MSLRPELPPLPERMRSLPVDRGYPVPWFVEWIEGDPPRPCKVGTGVPEFRIMSSERFELARRESRCWVCGEKLGRHAAFTIGPMCAVNRVSAEPPSHVECAVFSARGCPFLSRPHARRREAGMPEGTGQAAGIALMRNPGVALVFVTRDYRAFTPPGGGVLYRLGDPERCEWFCEGRPASRAEVLASIESGLPALRELAEQDGEKAVAELERMTERALALVPA